MASDPITVSVIQHRLESIVQEMGEAMLRTAYSQILNSSRQPINGVPTIVTIFDAATQQGVVRGVVSHFAYGGRTYQLLGYTPQSRFAAYDQQFERVIGSFRPVSGSPSASGARSAIWISGGAYAARLRSAPSPQSR